MLGETFQVTADELKEIFNVRLAPYLPANLEKVEPHPSGWGNSYTFKPFTGREARPEEPERYWDDSRLAYRHVDKDAGRTESNEDEYDLREKARFFLSEVYRQARIEWRNAAHVAELKDVVKDTGDRWKAHSQAKRAVEAAFAYLRDPEAAKEWTAAISRLVDAQDAYLTAAIAFDLRAQEIAEVHDRNFHEHMLGFDEALVAAGYPEAKDWHIAPGDYYGKDYRGEYDAHTIAGQAQTLITEQDAHVAKVGRLAGAAVGH
ncbi:hypothetical protein I5Q34_26740 [Streptomyces sp. AV19]|uniref:hypothetical protein n=1 Tax=Streptomyces sp. AV19 TaxID=2793068 RepID=UPI0018FEB02A|nr:hypothetical protein [Streptomyces sp. AV19]MBH1937825.1 hypothetical protein [Streptomyces sp. AV19]MDG4537103.1 hypothetical protein [Streptomyces sp. AV19]